VLAPGARPPHTLCPSIVFAGDAIVAAGCQGGCAQPQILAQVASDIADPASDLHAAVSRPRWIVGGPDLGSASETVLAEPGAQAPEAEAAATGVAFERLSEPTGMAGHVQAARLGPDGLSAGSDPRADGGVLLT
jgi:oxamate amidohydrolase